MKQRKENWLLKKINEQVEKNGKVDEVCLKLIYTQINYHNEFLEMLEEFKLTDSVSAYLYMKKTNSYMELMETFKNKQVVRDYIYMINQINMVDEILDSLRNNGWCHHILVGDGNKHRCVRCGVTINSNLDCNDYIVTDSFDYDEARILYESVIDKKEFGNVDDIIKEMILARSERKVKRKSF